MGAGKFRGALGPKKKGYPRALVPIGGKLLNNRGRRRMERDLPMSVYNADLVQVIRQV